MCTKRLNKFKLKKKLNVYSKKGIAIYMWAFGCSFACATTIGYAGFKLSFGITILL